MDLHHLFQEGQRWWSSMHNHVHVHRFHVWQAVEENSFSWLPFNVLQSQRVFYETTHIFLPPTSAMEVIESVPPVCVCLCGFLRATLCTTSWVQEYVVHHRPALCTPKLCCAPWCTRGTYCYQLQPWWCTIRRCQSNCYSDIMPNSYPMTIQCHISRVKWLCNPFTQEVRECWGVFIFVWKWRVHITYYVSDTSVQKDLGQVLS